MRARGVAVDGGSFRTLGRSGLRVSKIGYGSYRAHAEVEEHVQTLLTSLLHGINLIDTSTNYTDGGSERLVGNVLNVLIESHGIRRENVVLVSKIGYAQGANYEIALKREADGDPFAEMIKYQTGLWHCIHPDWLVDQLSRSLERLQVEHLDVLLLHNPEYFFTNARAHGGAPDIEQLRGVFYERMTEAFEQMERFVEEGRISWYGVSSNTFAMPPDTWDQVSLERVLECAQVAGERVRGDGDTHHFAVAQLPMNLYEAAAFAEDSGGDGHSFLEVAQSADIGVLTNRPMNAFVGNTLVRLAQYPHRDEVEDAPRVVSDVTATEGEILNLLESSGEWESLQLESPTRLFFNVGEAVAGVFEDLNGREQWLQAYEHFIAPSVVAYVRHVDDNIPDEMSARWIDLRDIYRRSLLEMAATVTSYFNRQETVAKQPLRDALVDELGPDADGLSLSQIAIDAVASVPGVTSVLCGLKREPYVHEATRLLGRPDFLDPYAAFRAPAKQSLSE